MLVKFCKVCLWHDVKICIKIIKWQRRCDSRNQSNVDYRSTPLLGNLRDPYQSADPAVSGSRSPQRSVPGRRDHAGDCSLPVVGGDSAEAGSVVRSPCHRGASLPQPTTDDARCTATRRYDVARPTRDRSATDCDAIRRRTVSELSRATPGWLRRRLGCAILSCGYCCAFLSKIHSNSRLFENR